MKKIFFLFLLLAIVAAFAISRDVRELFYYRSVNDWLCLLGSYVFH